MNNIETRRSKRFAIGLFLTTALSTVATSQPAFAIASEQQAFDVYFASQHTYCDAVLVARLWNIEVADAKIQIGEKILNGIGDNIPSVLQASRNQGNQCYWEQGHLPYRYEDAETIAALWSLGSVSEAKSKMAMLATNGNQHWIDDALRR